MGHGVDAHEDEGGGTHGDEGHGAEARGAVLAFAIESDGGAERSGDEESEEFFPPEQVHRFTLTRRDKAMRVVVPSSYDQAC